MRSHSQVWQLPVGMRALLALYGQEATSVSVQGYRDMGTRAEPQRLKWMTRILHALEVESDMMRDLPGTWTFRVR